MVHRDPVGAQGRTVKETIAAIFVDERGPYIGLPDVEAWTRHGGSLSLFGGDHQRDAMRYAGPWPVVGHPPCSRWCRLAGLVEARWGHRRGEDGGAFAHALGAVRAFGGVLEHPAYSDAWEAFELPRPDRRGGWHRGPCGGWSCHAEQGRYGHPAKKATWLYACGVLLPDLAWGHDPDQRSQALVSWCGNHVRSGERRPRVGKRTASKTPESFREILVAMARSAHRGHRTNERENVARWGATEPAMAEGEEA